MKTTEQIVSFGQGNVEALVKSGQILANGLQDLTKQVAATSQESFTDAVSTFRAITSARSVKDAIELQASLARSAMETAVRQTSQVFEASIKLTEQAMAPIAQRVTVAAGTFSRNA